MLKDFKDFAVRGNVVDMAVGIVVGGAFALIVKSFVADVIMPPIGLLLGGVDFSNLFWVLKESATTAGPYVSLDAAKAAGAVTLNFGLFVNTIVSFAIVAFAIFMVISWISKLKKQEEAVVEEPTTKECKYCYSDISLKATRCPNCTSEVAS